MKILLVLYGIGRGPRRSHRSIYKNLIEPIRFLGEDLKIIYIFKDDSANVVRDNNKTEISDCLKSEADIFKSVTEEDLMDVNLYNLSKTYQDKHLDNFVSNSHLIWQLRKIQLSTTICDYSAYDRVILCRDDLEFWDGDLDWSSLFSITNYMPITTTYFWNNGMCERFMVGKPDIIKFFANRIVFARRSMEHSGCLNGEYLQLFVSKTLNLKIAAKPIRFARIRSEGVVVKERLHLAFWRPQETANVLLAYFRYLKCKTKILIG